MPVLDLPAAFQRIPPESQIDCSLPQGQVKTQRRESASAASNHFLGMIALKNRCVRLMTVYLVERAGFWLPP